MRGAKKLNDHRSLLSGSVIGNPYRVCRRSPVRFKAPFVNEILQVPRCGGARCPGNTNIILSTEPAFEAIGPFAEHTGECLVLTWV